MSIKAYHGSSALFDRFEQSKSRVVNDFYGGGVAYFTTDRAIALKYAKNMAKVRGSDTRVIYDCSLNLRKTFDVNKSYSGDELKALIRKGELEPFARSAGLLKYGSDREQVLIDLEKGIMSLTGEQVFRGLSNGMVNTSKTRERLKSTGYDSLRYNGGLNMSDVRHDVYIVYNSNLIRIEDVSIMLPKPVDEMMLSRPIKTNVMYEAQ